MADTVHTIAGSFDRARLKTISMLQSSLSSQEILGMTTVTAIFTNGDQMSWPVDDMPAARALIVRIHNRPAGKLVAGYRIETTINGESYVLET